MNKHIWDHHVIGIVSTNCYVFGDPKEAIMLDPGGEEAIQIANDLKDQGIEIKHVMVSHGHFDHLGWAAEVQDLVEGAKVYLHEDEKEAYEPFLDSITAYGLDAVTIREPDVWLSDNQILDLGGYKFKVIHTPGHSPGSVIYQLQSRPDEQDLDYIPLQSQLSAFVGDTIFQGSIGRVDLPYSNKQDMIGSLHRIIDEIPQDTHLLPGHGDETYMHIELKNNPYLLAIQRDLSIF